MYIKKNFKKTCNDNNNINILEEFKNKKRKKTTIMNQ